MAVKRAARFQAVNLSLNLAQGRHAMECNGDTCNDGGSYGCLSPTDKCPPGTCAGTSCKKSTSAGVVGLLDATILVSDKELTALKAELLRVIASAQKR